MITQIEKKRISVNLKLTGEPAEWLTEWKKRGIISGYTDAVLQGLMALRDRINEQDLKAAKLQDMEDES
jgi:hypothetical protein